MRYKHVCFKCRTKFEIEHEIDTDKPTCNDCFAKLIKIKTAKDYQAFISSPNHQ